MNSSKVDEKLRNDILVITFIMVSVMLYVFYKISNMVGLDRALVSMALIILVPMGVAIFVIVFSNSVRCITRYFK